MQLQANAFEKAMQIIFDSSLEPWGFGQAAESIPKRFLFFLKDDEKQHGERYESPLGPERQ